MKPQESLIGQLCTDVFPFTVIVVIGDFQPGPVHAEILALNTRNPIATLKECEDLAEEMEARPSAGGYLWHLSPVTCMLWIANGNDQEYLAHEAFHAVYWFLSNMGIQLTPETNEVYAYLLTWLVKGVNDGLREFWDNEAA